MNIALYMDVNVRAEITRQLRAREVDVLTSEEDGTREFSDSTYLTAPLSWADFLYA